MLPKLYHELASWFPLLSPLDDYAEAAEFYWRLMAGSCEGPVKTILELGCGGGHNAFFMKKKAAMTLSDLLPAMLAMSRSLNPSRIEREKKSIALCLSPRFW